MNSSDPSTWRSLSWPTVVDHAKIDDALSRGDRLAAMTTAYGESSARLLVDSERAGFSMFSHSTIVPTGSSRQIGSLACIISAAASSLSAPPPKS